MNNRHTELYNNLLSLTQANEAFYLVDQEIDNTKFRVFAYRLASYTDWLLPDALEARGIMFELDTDNNPVRLACRPMAKFFNLDENPFTMNLDLNDIEEIQLKVDGSLISTYIVNDKLYLKSKTSLHSEHCVAAMKYLGEDLRYKEELKNITKAGFTVNLEWCSPYYPFRIVIGYEKPTLIVLNIRNIQTGEYVDIENGELIDLQYINWAQKTEPDNIPEFINSISSLIGVEGYVSKFKNGLWIKTKSIWYQNLHHTKDSVNNPRRLYECVINETTDDLRALFHDDPTSLSLISDMEERASKLYNNVISSVEKFYEANKALSRKEFAILGQKELDRRYFSLTMLKYLGKDINYKQFMVKNYKEFGIRDMVIENI